MKQMEEFLNAYPSLHLSIALRLGMIRKESLPQLSDDQFYEALWGLKWKAGIPMKFHEIIDDIFQLKADEIVAFLSKKTIIDGRSKNLNEFASYFKGETL